MSWLIIRSLLAVLLWLLTVVGNPGHAQQTPGDGPLSEEALATTAPAAKFALVVNAPAPLQAFLLTHLDLQRFRSLPDLDRTELARLVAQVPADATKLLATLGYMTPAVTADMAVSSATNGLPDTAIPQVSVTVQPGPLTHVSSVALSFTGDIAQRLDAADQREAIQDAFALQTGQPFTQTDWDAAKNRAMRALTAQRYPAGRISHSLADIDPVTHSAALTLVLESGPALRIGDIVVSGTERYDPLMVQRLVRLAGLTPGSDYDLAHVLDAQRRVADSGYFASVFILVEPGNELPSGSAFGAGVAPVQVKVREIELQKLVLGIGGSTDSGARLSIEHTHHRIPGLRWRAVSGLTVSRNNQSAQTALTSPVDDAGWRWAVSGLVNKQIDESGTTLSQRLRAGQTQDNPTFSRSLFVQYDRARTTLDGVPTEGQAALSANFAWTLRRLDHVLFPERGYSLGFELGSGLTLEQSKRPYLRSRVRGLYYLPLAADKTQEDPGRLALRAELGAVWARGEVAVPSTELFLTGGDNTVRGYALRSIGVPLVGGGVDPGRVIATGSVEWQRPLVLNNQRSAWENTFFVDAGAVSDKAATLRAKVGLGTGVRYRSPVGPLQLDLAYGVATRRLRLHMTLGFKF